MLEIEIVQQLNAGGWGANYNFVWSLLGVVRNAKPTVLGSDR